MKSELSFAVALCESIARLLHPHAEVVLHDLATERILHLANALSPRRVGDPSLLDEIGSLDAEGDVIGPYEKTNPDGRRLKSVSTIIRDGEGQGIGLLCINLDVDVFARLAAVLDGFLASPQMAPQPAALFAADWRESVNRTIGACLVERNVTFAGLGVEGEDALIDTLDQSGTFGFRNAMPYVAEVFGWSRAKLYNRLNRVRAARKGE